MVIVRQLRGAFVTLLLGVSMVLAVIPLLTLALVKIMLPPRSRHWLMPALDRIASAWIGFNCWQQRWSTGTRVELSGDLALSRDQWYMLIANHQSWVDILVMLRALHGRIPYVKFFLKKSLIWLPVLGVGCWALDFPFMRRYTRAEIERNPSLAGKDIEETRVACERYRDNPVTIVSYVEGTRFTPAKHARQQSPYRHLLIPRAGGLAFTLSAMNGQLHTLLDVTIAYPEGRPSYWEYVCGKVGRVKVDVRLRDIDTSLLGDYNNDERFKAHFQAWLNSLWEEKDRRLTQLLEQPEGQVRVSPGKL
ncbi:acyltransferase [Marinimicrobium alkaliphilum]|uniref:acyltransferase n=1 Tax=Marinimicrobium alkaliphilum TaxID=2202654 RepID=UPI000DBA1FCC|nr:acyltransferase [Marinimicrobium alkaliphilum]